jgi:pyridoxamine 5'-phosphate oxidase
MNPVNQIAGLLGELRSQNLLAPMCLSTIGFGGTPNSRFVDLKEVSNGRLFFGTDNRSTKAKEFTAIPGVSICGWWEPVQTQVRVIGNIEMAPESLSDSIFEARNRTAKAITSISRQSELLTDPKEMRERISEFLERSGPTIERPSTWSVFGIVPSEIEILTFSEDRMHRRTQYISNGISWSERELSP